MSELFWTFVVYFADDLDTAKNLLAPYWFCVWLILALVSVLETWIILRLVKSNEKDEHTDTASAGR